MVQFYRYYYAGVELFEENLKEIMTLMKHFSEGENLALQNPHMGSLRDVSICVGNYD